MRGTRHRASVHDASPYALLALVGATFSAPACGAAGRAATSPCVCDAPAASPANARGEQAPASSAPCAASSMASPRASSAPPPANAAPLASGANDGDADAPPMRRIERDDPQVTLAYPLFRFASAQASEQLAATFERDALQREASFLRLHRGRPAAELDGRAAYVRYACRATLAKPSIASVACTEVMELGAIAATRESGSTWLVDGAAVKPLVVRDLFRANANANAAAGAPAERGYVARVRGAINEVRAGCAMPLVDDRSFERALGGVSVDAEELTVYVTASSGCSARGYAARLRWRDIEAELDPAGPYRRIVKS